MCQVATVVRIVRAAATTATIAVTWTTRRRPRVPPAVGWSIQEVAAGAGRSRIGVTASTP